MLTEVFNTLRDAFPDYNHLVGTKDPTEIPQNKFPFFAYYVESLKVSPKGGSSFEVLTNYIITIGIKADQTEPTDVEQLKETSSKVSTMLLEKGFTKEPVEVEYVYRQPNVFAILKFQTTERV